MIARLIDRHVRFVGDVVAIVAGRDEKCGPGIKAHQSPV